MKYNAPYGSADPNAGYIDRNTPGAVRGSVPPAAAIEHVQREVIAVITGAGLTPSKDDLTQLKQAITAMIAAATGGADTSGYVLMNAARARLPIFPEALTSDGVIPCLSPGAGQVRVPAGYEFVHRGIYSITTAQTDFATAANKTYHLRWTPGGGFALKDLADTGYNPSVLAEADGSFDSAYDNMLVARVVTNASNVPTITNLVNKHRLLNLVIEFLSSTRTTAAGGEFNHVYQTRTINWSRTPKITGLVGNGARRFTGAGAGDPRLYLGNGDTLVDGSGASVVTVNRYEIKPVAVEDTDITSTGLTLSSQLSMTMIG